MKEISSGEESNLLFNLYLEGLGVSNYDTPFIPVVMGELVGEMTVNLYLVIQNKTIFLIEEDSYFEKMEIIKTMHTYMLDSKEMLFNAIKSLLYKNSNSSLKLF